MTAVIRPAEALLAASIRMRSSIRWSLTGAEMGCTMKTSRSRMFSLYLTKVLSLLNFDISQSPGAMPR